MEDIENLQYDESKKNVKPKEKYNDKLWQSSYGEADLTQQDDNFKLASDYTPVLKCNEETIYQMLITKDIYEILENDAMTNKIIEYGFKLTQEYVLHIYSLVTSKLKTVSIIEKLYCICEYGDFKIKTFFDFLTIEDKQELVKELQDRKKLNKNFDIKSFFK